MPRLLSFAVILALLTACTDNREGIAVSNPTPTEVPAATSAAISTPTAVASTPTAVAPTPTKAASPLTPAQVASGLNDLTVRIRDRINLVSDRMDEGATNTIRRRTLRFRMRASDVAWRAVHNPNHLAGLVELWFWMTAVDGFANSAAAREALGDRVSVLIELGSGLHSDVETFAKQALPAKGFASLKLRIEAAAASGEVLTTSPQREQAIIGNLLEVTQLQSVLNIALSPFEALRGIGSGADSVAALTITADRAVDLLERYPEIIAWNLRLAVIDIEEQDTSREARAALRQTLKLTEEMPARLRGEVTALLDSTGPAQQQMQQTLREITAAAAALNTLNSGVQQTLAAVERLSAPTDPAKPKEPGRPFDIREYTAALEAATKATSEAHQAINAVADKGLPAADAAAAGFEAAANRVLWKIAALLGFAALLTVGVIVVQQRLKRQV